LFRVEIEWEKFVRGIDIIDLGDGENSNQQSLCVFETYSIRTKSMDIFATEKRN